MNIALWAPFFKNKVSDFEDFVVETIPHFILQRPNGKFFILTDTVPSIQPAFPGNTEIIITRPPQQNILLKKIWWDVKLPSVLKKIKAHLFISFADNCSLTAAIPQFIVIYEAEKLRSSLIKKSRLVFVMSESMKTQLIKTHRILQEKIVVIYPATAGYYLPADTTKKEEVKKKYSEGKEFFFIQ